MQNEWCDITGPSIASQITKRKAEDSNMDVSDRITVEVESNPQLDKAFTTFADYIKTETLCTSLEIKAGVEGEVFEIAEGLSVKVRIRK